jgi:hypothetical protein
MELSDMGKLLFKVNSILEDKDISELIKIIEAYDPYSKYENYKFHIANNIFKIHDEVILAGKFYKSLGIRYYKSITNNSKDDFIISNRDYNLKNMILFSRYYNYGFDTNYINRLIVLHLTHLKNNLIYDYNDLIEVFPFILETINKTINNLENGK